MLLAKIVLVWVGVYVISMPLVVELAVQCLELLTQELRLAPVLFELASRDGHVWRIGLSVCYDLRFAELYREYAKRGVDLLLAPSAFTHTTGEAHWEVLLRARAIENLSFVAAAAQGGVHPSGRRRPAPRTGHTRQQRQGLRLADCAGRCRRRVQPQGPAHLARPGHQPEAHQLAPT